ncbi:hypothetical protein C9Z69_27820 (plasmid) [Escherichia coli]|nr:hypothetical protein AW075_21290 [Escherichia coli]TJQ34569.1 hypothetical protein C9Z69_27820 [Escherichia coli]
MVNQFFIIFSVFALSCIRTLKKQDWNLFMTNPPFQDFLCNVYYMRSVGELLVIYWLYVSYILVILLLRVSYRGVLRVNSGGT